MDPATSERLSQIEQETRQVENEKLQWEQRLGLFWEHPPALDPEKVGRAMQQIRDHIRGLEERKRTLIREQEFLIVGAASSIRGGNGNNGGN